MTERRLGRRGAAFVRKTLRRVAGTLDTTLASEEIARRNGFLQKVPAAPKIIALLAIAVVAAFGRTLSLMTGLYLLCLVLAVASHVPAKVIVGRVWLGVVLFTGVVLLPSLFNWVVPGTPLLVLAHIPTADVGGAGGAGVRAGVGVGVVRLGPWRVPAELAITREGLLGALLVLGRVAVSLSAATLLAVTSRWQELIRGLARLGAPRLFVGLLEMSYRYLVLLVQSAGELFEARESRTVGRPAGREARRFVGGAAGTLLARSVELSEEVYLAMRSRGYGAEPPGKDYADGGRSATKEERK